MTCRTIAGLRTLSLIAPTLLWSCPRNLCSAEEDAAPTIPINVSTLTAVSATFRQQTSTAIDTIPSAVLRIIGSAGWRIQLAEFVIDAQPDLEDDQPRGWPSDTTWKNTDAIHFPVDRLLVMAEKRRNSRGEVVPSTRIAGVLRHEMGHAFDMATGGTRAFRSASLEFRIAYATDKENLTPDLEQQLAYYLQGDNAGRQEAYAEAFGIVLGGGSDKPHEKVFCECFPAVVAFVRRDLQLE